MTRYPYLLFDADNTLFDFDEANIHAFRAVCDAFGLPFSQTLFDRFEIINNATWERFDRGELTKDETVLERFRAFFAAEGIRGLEPTACNRVHLASLSNATYLMPHAAEVIAKLRETHHIHLITNAVEAVQRGRLGRSALAPTLRRRSSPRPRVRRSRPWNTLTMCSPTSTALRGKIVWSSATRSRATFRARTTMDLRAAGSIRRKHRSPKRSAWTTRSATCGSFTTL